MKAEVYVNQDKSLSDLQTLINLNIHFFCIFLMLMSFLSTRYILGNAETLKELVSHREFAGQTPAGGHFSGRID
jgi:hypothetical protein